MTYRTLYMTARRQLDNAGIEAPGADTAVLLEHFFSVDRPGLAVHGAESPAPEAEKAFLAAVDQRCAHRPLQYILGKWDFMGLTLRVGEGVLIPREDTGILVETATEYLKDSPAPTGIDLCAGTGAVALGICALAPRAKVTCIELSPRAMDYLKENLAAYPAFDLTALQADILLPETAASFTDGSSDFLVSNPPYIRADELTDLQLEVQKEPALALDGGADGLIFYRAIAGLWVRKVKPGGLVAVEIGEDQGEEVAALFRAAGVTDLAILPDWAGLPRCVRGIKA